MNTINDQIRRHPFFAGFPEELFQGLRLCANPVTYADGETIYRQGDHAEVFFLVQSGRIALELQAGHQGTVIIQTISAGQMLGWSWLFEPFRRQFDARAVTAVTALALQAECLRHQCDLNHHLGHELLPAVFQRRCGQPAGRPASIAGSLWP